MVRIVARGLAASWQAVPRLGSVAAMESNMAFIIFAVASEDGDATATALSAAGIQVIPAFPRRLTSPLALQAVLDHSVPERRASPDAGVGPR